MKGIDVLRKEFFSDVDIQNFVTLQAAELKHWWTDADTMLRSKHGDTALDIAQRFKNKDVVRVLDGQLW